MDATARRLLILVLASGLAAGAAFAQAAGQTAPPGDAPEEEDLPYWVLEEFDWGDSEEVVGESVVFDPYFTCSGTVNNPCILVSTVVGGEKLLATFQHHEGGLWQVVVLTPDLGLVQAREHIPRVWRVLVDYVSRFDGKPLLAVPLPDLPSLAVGPPQLTHFWSLGDRQVRILVGRRDEDLFYVAAAFSDPAVDAVARPAWEAAVAASDARKRRQRQRQEAARAQRSEAAPR